MTILMHLCLIFNEMRNKATKIHNLKFNFLITSIYTKEHIESISLQKHSLNNISDIKTILKLSSHIDMHKMTLTHNITHVMFIIDFLTWWGVRRHRGLVTFYMYSSFIYLIFKSKKKKENSLRKNAI